MTIYIWEGSHQSSVRLIPFFYFSSFSKILSSLLSCTTEQLRLRQHYTQFKKRTLHRSTSSFLLFFFPHFLSFLKKEKWSRKTSGKETKKQKTAHSEYIAAIFSILLWFSEVGGGWTQPRWMWNVRRRMRREWVGKGGGGHLTPSLIETHDFGFYYESSRMFGFDGWRRRWPPPLWFWMGVQKAR